MNQQRPGIDYSESSFPVLRLESLRTVLATATIHNLDIIRLDVTSVYRYVMLEEELYMEHPDGYAAPGKDDHV